MVSHRKLPGVETDGFQEFSVGKPSKSLATPYQSGDAELAMDQAIGRRTAAKPAKPLDILKSLVGSCGCLLSHKGPVVVAVSPRVQSHPEWWMCRAMLRSRRHCHHRFHQWNNAGADSLISLVLELHSPAMFHSSVIRDGV